MTNRAERYFVSAQPGFWLLELGADNSVFRVPIVAWEMMPIDEDKPHLACYAEFVTSNWGIARTTGAVLGPDGLRAGRRRRDLRHCEQEWLEAAKRDRAERAARKAS